MELRPGNPGFSLSRQTILIVAVAAAHRAGLAENDSRQPIRVIDRCQWRETVHVEVTLSH